MLVIVLLDVISLISSYTLVCIVRYNYISGYGHGLLIAGSIWILINYLMGAYSYVRKERRVKTRLLARFVAGIAIVGTASIYTWFTSNTGTLISRGLLIPFTLSTICLCLIGSFLVERRNKGIKAWTIICKEEEYRIIDSERLHNLKEKSDVRFASQWSDLDSQAILRNNEGFAISAAAAVEVKEIDSIIQRKFEGSKVVSLIEWCEVNLQRIPPELIKKDWLLNAGGFTLTVNSLDWRLKRLADIIGAIFLIGVTLPITLLAATCIFLEDRSWPLYNQIRTGLFGREIKIYKLRSMRIDAEKFGVQWAKKGDSRVTKVGRIIRALRIDELPQLFAVIKGDLSLIGPRPERPEIDVTLRQEIQNYSLRYLIKPGLTGWAQVNRPYGNSTSDSRDKLSYDLYYMRHSGLILDIVIAIKTMRLLSRASRH